MNISIKKLDLAQARAQLTCKDLEQKTGISRATISQIRRGARNPKPATIGKLASALNVDVEEIIES